MLELWLPCICHFFSLTAFLPAMSSYQGVITLALTVVLLALPSLTFGVTLHVRSTDTSCPTHPCHTLSEYAQDLGQYANGSNLTLQFLPGNHTLNVNLTITNMYQLEIFGSVVPTQIVCSSNVGLTFRNISEMKIDSLAFVSCDISYTIRIGDNYYEPSILHFGLFLQSIQKTEISDCTFQDNYGGALWIVDSHVVLSGNNSFLRNCRMCSNGWCSPYPHNCFGGGVLAQRSNVSFTGSNSFIGNSAEGGGGVYAWTNSNVDFSGNTTFIGNSAFDGGGVYAQDHSNVDISGNTTFIDNSVWWCGGGIYARNISNIDISGNTIFSGNSAKLLSGGGVCAQTSSSVYISGNIIFRGNSAIYRGGVVYAWQSNVSIRGNSTFIGNSAGISGGVVYLGSYSSMKIGRNSTFRGNSATNGGCIHVEFTYRNVERNVIFRTILSLEGSVSFVNCSATNDGGAIYATGAPLNFGGNNSVAHSYTHNSFLNLSGDSTFIANSAESRGGAIYAQETKIAFSGSGLFSGNMAQLDGGGIYAESSNLTFSGSITIGSNSAQVGGGIYLDNSTFNIIGHEIVEGNHAMYHGGGMYTRRSSLTLVGNSTLFANSAKEGGGIYATANCTLSLDGMNTFMANRAHVSGGGIWLDNSNLTLNGSSHFSKCVANYEGGAIFIYATTADLHGNITVESNSATTGGGVHARSSHVSLTKRCNFKHNNAVFGGGLFTDSSTFQFNGSSSIYGNQAHHTGGGVYASKSILNFLGNSSTTTNHAAIDGGGIYTRDGCKMYLHGFSTYHGNSAEETGGGISAIQSSITFAGHNTFDSNTAQEGGGIYTSKCTVNLPGENTFIANSASIHGGGFTVIRSTLHLNGSTAFRRNSAASGGGMYIGDSTVDIEGSNCFKKNTAKSEGGAIYARYSLMTFESSDAFIANTAESKGAAIYTSFSTLVFQGSSSFANNSAQYGGGIHSDSSNLTFAHNRSSQHTRKLPSCINCKLCGAASNFSISFSNNTALLGGAQYLDLYSNFSLHQTAHVHFQDNNATEFGGAIYVVDVPTRSECFFHLLNNQSHDMKATPLVFVNNSAGVRGSVLYGGLLDRCTFSSDKYKSALQLFNMSILQENYRSISSDPTQLCFCNINEPNCSVVHLSRSIYPGQMVEFSVIAVDQLHSAIPTLIHVTIHSGHNISETISYEIEGKCTSRSMLPNTFINQLELHPSNKSGITSHLFVNIIFEKCPIGFEAFNSTGNCICDHRLWQFTNSCDIDQQAVLRNASRTFWLGVSYNNGTPEGFIHHPFCPLDYCTSKRKYINLNNPDEQCKYNHSGLLCGKCKESLSLVLGSSQCTKCSNNYLALLIPFALAGMLLVILLFLLQLTVEAGTLHGLIFYANIVAANYHIFFPQSANDPASMFIAWLNLDLGIQTCFYNGMDAYAKTWLDLVFPVYIWVIMGFLIYISSRSIAVTKLLGSSPVPILASLFFLSYAKVLRTIISALSLTILHYPYKGAVVWIHDANVSLAKYIPLALVALLSLLFLFIPYTLLLLLGQWLQPKSHLCLFSWVNNPKLKAVLDTYHAPYKPKHRYWTGMLLLIRCALFLIFAFNINGDDSINILVTCSTAFGIFVLFTLSGMVYKSWYLNALEQSFILNLGILAAATYHMKLSGGSQAAVAYISVGIAFLSFVGILVYHIYMRIKPKVQCIEHGRQLQDKNGKCHEKRENPSNLDRHSVVIASKSTEVEVDLHELRFPLDLLDTDTK